jgi:hypothetical protein
LKYRCQGWTPAISRKLNSYKIKNWGRPIFEGDDNLSNNYVELALSRFFSLPPFSFSQKLIIKIQ